MTSGLQKLLRIVAARRLHCCDPVRRSLLLGIPLLIGIVLLVCCYHLPLWKGEVHVTPLDRASIAKCGTGKLTADGATRVTRDPYLQSTTTTSVTVAWGATDPQSQVVLSEPGGAVVKTVSATYAGDPEKARTRLAAQKNGSVGLTAEDIYVVKATFDGLEPTHLYCYQVVAEGKPLTELAPLTTASAAGKDAKVQFVALGDTGTGGAAQRAIAQQISTVPFELLVFLGDIAYESGTAKQLQEYFFAIYRDFLRYVPIYPAIGNHERRTRKGNPYFEAFVLPEAERYYSFDWGNVHFVAIDTTQRDAGQLAWLDADLARNKLPWTIVFGHHPMYTNSLRGAQLSIRLAFAKILTRHKVDLVLTGHEHGYERFKVGGVNYVVSGGGGGQLTHFFGTARSLKQATVHHFLAIEVTATNLAMRAINIDGKEIESLKLTKDGNADVKTKVNDVPDERSTPIAPEKEIKPDGEVHDGPDDDVHQPKVGPPEPAGPKTPPVSPVPQ